MTPGEWRDLSTSELRVKLVQKGFQAAHAATIARKREEPLAEEFLDMIFGVER